MIRNVFIGLLAALLTTAAFSADFTATYSRLADSPLGVATTWYSGGVTPDGKFVYGHGNSHDTTNNNSLWAFDPATNTHKNLFPNTGHKWRWVNDPVTGKPVAKSGYWAMLGATDPLYAFFGGPTITAMTNRNNHQAFVLGNEFWIVAGAYWDHGGNLWGGRFDLTTNRWANTSHNMTEFSAGKIAGTPGWVAANAATAVCKDLNTVVMFGGMANKDGGVRMIEPNVGPEPYKWSSAPKPPIYMPAENVRHNAVCVGDTVYFSSGQERVPNTTCCRTPVPGQFWKFHVPTRVWTRLTDGPPGGYFPSLTYDSDAQALLYYGGGTGRGSKAMWVYDLTDSTWHDLTSTTAAPPVDHHSGGFVPGFGHVYKGGRQFTATGVQMDYGVSRYMHKITLTRVVPLPPPPPPPEPDPAPVPTAGFTWSKIPLVGGGLSPTGSSKHQRLAEGPGGRVYFLGGDWGGPWGENSGRQEVYSFNPLASLGDWKLEAPYCGTVTSPVHWHTDEAGVAWDATRNVFWKLAGVQYGPDDACFLAGKSVKAKVIQYDPGLHAWNKPEYIAQKNIGYVTNGVLDPVKDEMIQIIDKAAWHLNLDTGTWTSYPLWGEVIRFNAITARLGRDVWWCNRKQMLESYNLDTHKLTQHSLAPWPVPTTGWTMQMVMAAGDKVLVIKPTARPDTPRNAAYYDPATKTWTPVVQGDGWGNTAMWHSSGKLIMTGGGIDGPEYHNKQVFIGTPK